MGPRAAADARARPRRPSARFSRAISSRSARGASSRARASPSARRASRRPDPRARRFDPLRLASSPSKCVPPARLASPSLTRAPPLSPSPPIPPGGITMAPAVVQPTMASRFAGLFASRRGASRPRLPRDPARPSPPLPRRHFRGASLGGFGLRAWSRARWPIASPAARLAPGGRVHAARCVPSRSSDAPPRRARGALAALDAARRRRGDAAAAPPPSARSPPSPRL